MKINGIKVVDASKPVILTITARDVTKGDTKDPGACAAAQACMRELHAIAARVHIGRTYLQFKDKWVRYETRDALRNEIIAFDRGGSFAPGKYVLGAVRPSQVKHRGLHQGGPSPSKPRRLKKKRAAPHTVTGIRHHGANR